MCPYLLRRDTEHAPPQRQQAQEQPQLQQERKQDAPAQPQHHAGRVPPLMACYHPIPAYQDRPGAEVHLWPPVGTATTNLPCGKCIGCRTDLATDWARRAEHEASQWEHNCFVTLTYDDDHLPEHGHLRPKDLQKFIKRLRQAVRRTLRRREPTILSVRPTGPRYLACGEYGENTNRPHFHLLLFNCAFSDQKAVGKDLHESATLARYWKLGGHRIGQLTGASANYVAQYSFKKLALPEGSYEEDDGNVIFIPRHDIEGEIYKDAFLRASTVPPIGNGWVRKYGSDLKHGFLIAHGKKQRIPRAVKKQLQKIDPQLAEQAALAASDHKRTKHDLRAAEQIHEAHAQLHHKRNKGRAPK